MHSDSLMLMVGISFLTLSDGMTTEERRFMIIPMLCVSIVVFFFQAEDGIRDLIVTGVQTCALPISAAGEHIVSVDAMRPMRLAAGLCAVVTCWGCRDLTVGGPPSLVLDPVLDSLFVGRSEERRGGEEGRSRWSPYHLKKKNAEPENG